MTDVVGPGSAAVGLAGERHALTFGLLRPRTAQTGGREGAKVPPAAANRLDDHEVLVLALDGVDLNGFEEGVR